MKIYFNEQLVGSIYTQPLETGWEHLAIVPRLVHVNGEWKADSFIVTERTKIDTRPLDKIMESRDD